MKLSENITRKISIIENYLSSIIPNDNELSRAMNYSLLAGGKRIRPILTLVTCEAMDGATEEALPYAAAVEAVHTYSLIHDDLPAMDDDDLRRGKPTCHKKFNEATAILAGDALLTLAFELITKSGLPASSQATACGILAHAAGMHGMVLGQALDMEGQTSLQDLLFMYEKKTGALFKAAASLGAVAAGGKGNEFDDYCRGLGLAFQIKDDILDVYGDEKVIGKPTMSDAAKGKQTVLSFMSREAAEGLVESYTKEAVESIGFLNDKGDALREIAMLLTGRRD